MMMTLRTRVHLLLVSKIVWRRSLVGDRQVERRLHLPQVVDLLLEVN